MNSFFQKNLIKSQSTRDLYRGNLKPISNKDYQFTKTKNYILPNMNGTPPEILYYKDSNSHHNSNYQLNYGNSGGFISDGGLKKKYNKSNLEKSLIYNKSTGKLRSSIHSSNSNSKTLTKDPLSKSMKNIRKNTNQTPLYESKNNSIKANKYHTSSCRSMKNIFSLKNKINKNFQNKNINKTNKKKTEKDNKKKINNQKQKNEENEEEKYEKMNQLIENKIASYIRDLQTKKKPTLEEERNEAKQKVLLEHGIEIRIDSTEDDEEPKEEDENNYENEKENAIEEEKLSSNNLNSSKNFIRSKRAISPKVNNYILNDDNKKNNKKKYESVNSFEYINIIKNLSGIKKEKNLIKSNSTSNIYNNNLNNSFRKSNSINNNNKLHLDDINNNKNKNKIDELKKINFEKLIKEKYESIKKKNQKEEFEKYNKDFLNYRNLYNLNLWFSNNRKKNGKRKKKKIKSKKRILYRNRIKNRINYNRSK